MYIYSSTLPVYIYHDVRPDVTAPGDSRNYPRESGFNIGVESVILQVLLQINKVFFLIKGYRDYPSSGRFIFSPPYHAYL